MQSPESIIKNLENEEISFELLRYDENHGLAMAAEELNIDPHQIVRMVHFRDFDKHFITVVPISQILDVEVLQEKLEAHARPVAAIRVDENTIGLESNCVPPFGTDEKCVTLVDKSLDEVESLYFPIEINHEFLKISRKDFIGMQSKCEVMEFSVPLNEVLEQDYSEGLNFKKTRLIERVENITGLPAMPEMGYRILQISRDSNTTAKELAKAIEVDPSLSAQIMSYSTSAYYGYQGKISSVREAISRVLGFDLVANLALGIAVGKKFSISAKGALGLSSFWRHAVYSSAMAEKLAKVLPKDLELNPGLAYLCGLLHNFGYLLVGHIFAPGFDILNKTATANPDIPITVIENFCLGAGHEEIGAKLLEQWHMPQETIDTARWHHNSDDYDEDNNTYNYIQLVQLVDKLLWRYGIGDENSGVIPETILSSFNVEEEQVLSVVRPLLETCLELDNMAAQLSG